MEQAADLVYANGRMLARPDGELARHSLAHIARGASAVLHFQWRSAPGGAELWHAAMLPHTGPDSPVFEEVCALGARLRDELGAVSDVDTAEPARVAIVWDPQAWWALQAPGLPASDLDYLAEVARVHAAVGELGLPVDFVAPEGELAAYQMVLVPGLYPVSDAAAANLTGFAGTLVVWHFSGVVDERLRVRLGGHPGAFRERLGIRVTRFTPLPPGEVLALASGARAEAWRECVRPDGATVEDRYPDGGPAVTRHGTAWYVSTRLDPAALRDLLGRIADSAGVGRPAAPPPTGVDIRRRGDWTFVINNGASPVTVAIPGYGTAGGSPADERLWLPAGGCVTLPGNPR